MAAQPRRLHLFIVSATGRRQNVCLLICICVCVYTRKNEKEEESTNHGVCGEEGGGRRKGSGGCGGGAGGGTELSLAERASEPVSRPRKKEKERGKGEREREKERRLAPLTGWPAVERSSCTLIRAPVVAFIYRRLPLSGASAAF